MRASAAAGLPQPMGRAHGIMVEDFRRRSSQSRPPTSGSGVVVAERRTGLVPSPRDARAALPLDRRGEAARRLGGPRRRGRAGARVARGAGSHPAHRLLVRALRGDGRDGLRRGVGLGSGVALRRTRRRAHPRWRGRERGARCGLPARARGVVVLHTLELGVRHDGGDAETGNAAAGRKCSLRPGGRCRKARPYPKTAATGFFAPAPATTARRRLGRWALPPVRGRRSTPHRTP